MRIRNYLCLGIFFGASAVFAATPDLVRDSGGMPTAFHIPGEPGNVIQFSWHKGDEYIRKIFVRIVDTTQSSDPLEYYNNYDELPDGVTTYQGIAIPAEAIRALEQVRRGANLYRTEDTVEEFVTSRSFTFDHDQAEKFTWDYGPEFTAKIFKYVRDHRPANQRVRARIQELMTARDATLSQISKQYAGVTVLMVRGYMQREVEGRTQRLFDLLKSSGIAVEYLKTETADPVSVNREIIAADLKTRLAAGQNIVIGGASKGFPEVMGAVADISSLLPSYPGKLKAVFALSGVVGGSFVADYGAHEPLLSIAGLLIKHEAKAKGLEVHDAKGGLVSMTSRYLHDYYESFRAHLPQDIPYIEITGVSTRDYGLAPDHGMQNMQLKIYDSFLMGHFSANDGFVEYPGTEIPESWVKHRYQITLDSSHEIDDGDYEGISLRDQKSYETVLRAIFAFVGTTFDQP